MDKTQRNPKVYKAILAVVLLTVTVFAAACSNSQEVVANVEGKSITKDELYDAMVKQGGQQALDVLIMKKIVEMEVEKQDIRVSDQAIDEEMDQIAEQYGGLEAFEQIMGMYGYSTEGMKEDIEMNLKIQALLKPRISITEEEMKEYFEQNKESFAVEEQEANYEQSKEQIEGILFDGKVQAEFNTWYQEKLDEYEIENFLTAK